MIKEWWLPLTYQEDSATERTNHIMVIEKAAYDKLKAEHDKMKAEHDKMKACLTLYKDVTSKAMNNIGLFSARECLADLEQEKK